MKRGWLAAVAACVVFGSLCGDSLAQGTPTPPFEVRWFIFCTSMEGLEPGDARGTFPAGNQMIVAYLEAREIVASTTVTFVWKHEGKEVRSMTAELPKGRRWRTFDGKIPQSMVGRWTVELRDAAGTVIESADFVVE